MQQKLQILNLAKKLSEINLKYGGDVVLTFSGVNYPVVIWKRKRIKKNDLS